MIFLFWDELTPRRKISMTMKDMFNIWQVFFLRKLNKEVKDSCDMSWPKINNAIFEKYSPEGDYVLTSAEGNVVGNNELYVIKVKDYLNE